MSNYRRTSKPKRTHQKASQSFKTIATIGILGLITASITIMNAWIINKILKRTPDKLAQSNNNYQKEVQKESLRKILNP